MRARPVPILRRVGAALAALTVTAVTVAVLPPLDRAQAAPEPLPPGCVQPASTATLDLPGCLYASTLGTISGTAWTVADPPRKQGMVVQASNRWCGVGDGIADLCTTNASIEWVYVHQGGDPASRPVFYQPSPPFGDPWGSLAACDITPETLPVESNTMARCYDVGEGNVALTEVIPLVVTARVTIQGVEETAAQGMGGVVTSCLGIGPRYCRVTQWVSVVGTVSPGGTDLRPTAAFDYRVGANGLVTFLNLSSDPEDAPEDLRYRWSFGDGEESTDQEPVHRYGAPGTYSVTLEVTDTNDNTASITRDIEVGSGLVVNSTGDAPAEDPAAGCDTGELVGDVPECTLRAALEVANARGGTAGDGETVSFAIDTDGVPTVTLTSQLPGVTAAGLVIDGTTQSAGRVRVDGAGVDTGLQLTGEGITVRGMAFDRMELALALGGADAVVEDVLIGLDSGVDPVPELGVSAEGDRAAVRDSVLNATVGVLGIGAETVLTGNRFGVAPSADTVLAGTGVGVLGTGPDLEVDGNVVRASVASILVVGADATGVRVTNNRVGIGSGSTLLPDQGIGIRIDGAPGAHIEDNVVVAGPLGDQQVAAHIELVGSRQTSFVDGSLRIRGVNEAVAGEPVTGGQATVTGNTVGAAAAGVPPRATSTLAGVMAWGEAPSVAITGNEIADAGMIGVYLLGGAGHRAVDNRIGSASTPVLQGVSVDRVGDTVLGAPGAGNTIVSDRDGVTGTQTSGPVTVASNTVTQAPLDLEFDDGIHGDDRWTITGNVVVGFHTGIGATSDSSIVGNRVEGSGTGIYAGLRTTVERNTVFGTLTVAIRSLGGGNRIVGNVVGRTRSGGPVVGNQGHGIEVASERAEVTGNDVAGSGGSGVTMTLGGSATMRGNAIRQSGAAAIAGAAGVAVPEVVAIDTSAVGTPRTTLLVTGLPTDQVGTIEVFANGNCDTAEAETVLGVTRETVLGSTLRIVQLTDRPDADHFTVTFTDASGRTSALSECASVEPYPDGDGDGVVDPIDDLVGGAADPGRAAVVTDDERVLSLVVDPFDAATGSGGGRLTQVAIVDDPSPGTHPSGFRLAYGALRFVIEGLRVGASTGVTLVPVDGSDVEGAAYWKYGPPEPGATSEWFDFTGIDPATGTGATEGTTMVEGSLRRSWHLALTDGQRGDSSGPDGVIVDPGGPGTAATPDPGGPEEPDPATTSTTVATVTTAAGELPRTGSGPTGLVVLAVALVAVGLAAVGLSGRARRRQG